MFAALVQLCRWRSSALLQEGLTTQKRQKRAGNGEQSESNTPEKNKKAEREYSPPKGRKKRARCKKVQTNRDNLLSGTAGPCMWGRGSLGVTQRKIHGGKKKEGNNREVISMALKSVLVVTACVALI